MKIDFYVTNIKDSKEDIKEEIIKTQKTPNDILKNFIINENEYYLSDLDNKFKIKIESLKENNYIEEIKRNGIIKNLKDKDFIVQNFDIKNNIILKPVSYLVDESFLDKWNSDKLDFNNNIIEIYIYGSIYDNDGNYLNDYIIIKEYGDINDIKKVSFDVLKNYFFKLLEFLDELTKREYIIRNLMSYNIGIDYYEKEVKFIFLEYNINTLVKKNGNFFEDFKQLRCNNKLCGGNLIPYYVIYDYYYLNENWLNRLDKLYSLGLVEIILSLFYVIDNNLKTIYNFIVRSSILDSNLQYYHFKKRFDSEKNISIINNLLLELKLKFCDLNPIIENNLQLLILNLLKREYEDIYNINQIRELVDVFNDYNEFKLESKKEEIYNPNIDITTNYNDNTKRNIISKDNLKRKYIKYKKKYINLKNLATN